MENKGTRVFPENIDILYEFYSLYLKKQLKIANVNGGKGLNFRSSKQMRELFYTKKGYKPYAFTPANNPRLNGEDLTSIAEEHHDVLANAILEYRGGAHILTAFLDNYRNFMTKESASTWVLHPNFKQCGPVTGRFSCSDPNLMNVAAPVSNRRWAKVISRTREAFGPRKGYLWYLPDYSQIEVWVYSFLAQEKIMMKALLSGKDFHGTISKEVWENEPDYATRMHHYRQCAKLLMFCNIYGGGTKKIALLMRSSYNNAKKFNDKFYLELPGVKQFGKRMTNKATREGKIVSPFGRTYFFKSDFAYKAVSHLVQGSAADIIKRAMIALHELFQTKWKGCYLLLTIHDELVIEIPEHLHSKLLIKDIEKCMQLDSHEIIGCPVPLPISLKIAKKSWSELTDVNFVMNEWKEKYTYNER